MLWCNLYGLCFQCYKKDIAEKIITKEADYLLAVGNQKRLEKAINEVFNSSMSNNFEGDKIVVQERGHARTETRLCLVEYDVGLLGDVELDWPQLSTLVLFVSKVINSLKRCRLSIS